MEPNTSQQQIEIIEEKEALLQNQILQLKSIMVAYSGGVDSSLLAYYCKKILKEKARVVIGVSASLANDSLIAARSQAAKFDWCLEEVETDETELNHYQKNDGMRCFYCKATLFDKLTRIARSCGIDHIATGANVDDLMEFRPGHMAADQFQIVSPLVDAGLTKPEIRFLAKRVNLPSWSRPQDACLASRIPVNTIVTVEKLSRVELAESFIRSLGFEQVRVRHYENRASVEVGQSQLFIFDKQPEISSKIKEELTKIGFSEVSIDPRGYRTGAVSVPVQMN